MSLFPKDVIDLATESLSACRERGLMIVTAESCTGGLIAAALTEIAGSSDVVDRGFVTYSNAAKTAMLDVSSKTLGTYGAVSKETALEMAKGALANSLASISVAVTGVAGPGGGSTDKPVGLVHIAVANEANTVHRECRFGAVDREQIRLETVRTALQMILSLVQA
jgi:nicotinamide-nucleotide amidase